MTQQDSTRPAELVRIQAELAARTGAATLPTDLPLPAHDLHRDLTRVLPLLTEVLARVAELLQAETAVLWIYDEAASNLYPLLWRGLAEHDIAPLRVPFGVSSVGRCVKDRAPVHLLDATTSTDPTTLLASVLSPPLRSGYSTPMLTTVGLPIGVISVFYAAPTTPTASRLPLVETYARQAAEIVERGQLYAQAQKLALREQRRSRQLRGLADAAMALAAADDLATLLAVVTDAGRDIIGTHQALSLARLSGSDEPVVHRSLSAAEAGRQPAPAKVDLDGVLAPVLAGNVLLRTEEHRGAHPWQPGRSRDADREASPNLLAAPLIGRDGANRGLVALADKSSGSAFSAEDQAIIEQLAQMAGSAMQRLEALAGERLARRSAEGAARTYSLLSEASAVFAGSLDAGELIAALVGMVVPRLAEWAVLHLLDEDGGPVRLGHLQHQDPAGHAAVLDYLERFPITGGSALGPGAVLTTGVHELYPSLTEAMLQDMARSPAQLAGLRQILFSSALIVPLTARGRTFGALSMSRTEPYREADVAYALDLVRRAALAVDTASRYAFERELADGLQRSLLPRSLPTSPLLTAASRYLPGARGTQIGGDWYDLIEVAGGDLVLVVGDVMGRGVQAAAVMGQLRATVRAYALEGHRPAALLQRLDEVVLANDELHFTTCLVGRLDPRTRELCLASAGHLPPLLIGATGGGRFLELDPGLPIGVGGAVFVEQCLRLAPGDTVLLYTDGLVEDPRTGVGPGMDMLLAAAVAPVQSAEELCDRVLAACSRGGGQDDDTALLALVLAEGVGGAAEAPLTLDLAAVPESAAIVRHALRSLLGDQGAGDVGDTAELLVTELVANAARHTQGQVRVRAGVRAGLLLVEVLDSSAEMPAHGPDVDWDSESGRGIALVEALADRWGADPLPVGKRVWFELSLRPL